MPYFCICGHKCSACQENWRVIDEHKKAPSGRELPTESGEGERVTIFFIKTHKLRRLLPSRFACHLPLGGRLFSTFRKVRKRLLICRCQKCLCVTFVIVGCVGFLFYYFFCFWDQIPGNKAKSSRIRRNSIQSLALRCQDKRKALRA